MSPSTASDRPAQAAAPLLVLDSASLYYRSFHALPESMRAPDGRPHQAIRGFLSTISRLIGVHRPSLVVAAWDSDWRPDWRVALVPSYKTHRLADPDTGAEDEPDSLGPQVDAIAAILDAMGIARIGIAGYEADDVIGSLCAQARSPVIAVSGDRDLVQVVDQQCRLLLTVNGGMEKWPLLDPDAVRERFGVPAHAYVDMAALRGDPSDGLPGVPGIGAKTAVALIDAFGDLDALLQAAHAGSAARPLTPRLAGLLVEHEATVLAARTVARVATDLPVDPERTDGDPAELARLAAQWGVGRQVDDLSRTLRTSQTADE